MEKLLLDILIDLDLFRCLINVICISFLIFYLYNIN